MDRERNEERRSSDRQARRPRRLGLLAVALAAAGPVAAPARAADPAQTSVDVAATAQAELPVGTRDARRSIRRGLGRLGLLATDPATGRVRTLARLDGFLTSPSTRAASAIVRDYAFAHRAVLGLDRADLDGLALARRVPGRNGAETLVFTQSSRGVPAIDSSLRATLTPDRRLLSLGGAPRPDLPVPGEPAVSASAAYETVAKSVGSARRARDLSTAGDATRRTTFAGGGRASLVLYESGDAVRLGWQVELRESSLTYYSAVVDARSGVVQRRSNLVRSASARVHDAAPGAAGGGGQVLTEIGGYLSPGATTLTGPAAHAVLDPSGDNTSLEDVAPTSGADYDRPLSTVPGSSCPAAGCTWDPATPFSWRANAGQGATQLFYYVNRFHDHLAAAPISFTAAAGAFEASDALDAQALDGAATAGGLPDAAHVNNANMLTLPDGRSPIMQMYLWKPSPPSDPLARAVSGVDDPSIVYHEYTHGMLHRLLTDGRGFGALDGVQAGAIDEALADFYATDFLVGQGLQADDVTTPDVPVAAYSAGGPTGIRTEAVDCPVDSTADTCAGTAATGSGGYTFGDVGRIASGPEPHADGEIWAQTMWDLRTRLIADHGEPAGIFRARQLITDALRLAPPDPSFLDLRNAILLADRAAAGGDEAAIWAVFARRGMGYFASTNGTDDASPVQSFSLPPTPNQRTATVQGTVTERTSGVGQSDVQVAFSGFDTGLGQELAATTDDTGAYTISGVAPRTYPYLVARGQGGLLEARRSGVTVDPGVNSQSFLVDRDVAASAAGASIESFTGTDFSGIGCGPSGLIDSDGSVWSTEAPTTAQPTKAIVVRLPAPTNLAAIRIDPSTGCGDPPGSALGAFEVLATSGNNPATATYVSVANGAFTPADDGRLNDVALSSTVNNAQFVKLVAKGTQGGTLETDNGFMDVTELQVLGTTPAAQSPATTQGAVAVTGDSATVQGLVQPGGRSTAYRFDYGRTTTYGAATPFTQAGAGSAPLPVQAALTGLAAGTAVHYRLVAFRATPGGTQAYPGRDRVFITSGVSQAGAPRVPPTATTGAAQALSQVGATLSASVGAEGLPTTYAFEYGTTSGYGRQTATTDSGAGTMATTRTAPIGDLLANTTYHFRVSASNAAGTTQGADRTFTTSDPSPVAPPPPPIEPPVSPPTPPNPPRIPPPTPSTIPTPTARPKTTRTLAAVNCTTSRSRRTTRLRCRLRVATGVRSATVRLSRSGRTVGRVSGKVRSGRLPALTLKRAQRRAYRLSIVVRTTSGKSRTVRRAITL